MTSHVHTESQINTLDCKPGIAVWYSCIPAIINSIFTSRTYHTSRPLVNELFQKKDFINLFVNSNEIKRLNSFKAFKKQVEWLSGRFLVKQMIQHFFLPDHTLESITLSYQEQGAPFVSGHPDISLSLSHSTDYTIAACSIDTNQPIGIDIEKIGKLPDAGFLKTAFSQKERDQLKMDAQSVFKQWTIKEAYLKYIKKGFHEPLHKVEIINNKIYHHGQHVPVDVFSTMIDTDYVVSLVSGSTDNHH